MSVLKIEAKFNEGFKGQLITKKTAADVGSGEKALAPYDMLFGALATCLYSTFLDVIQKKRITFESSNVIVTGEKREDIPTTLKWVNVVIEIKDASNEKGILKAAELAKKYCSVYETISKVAKMNIEVKFI
ncbi:MAG: OsmC family protein [Clostridia bacterium]|nr:OsmC family protein [Clostridia bacterium]